MDWHSRTAEETASILNSNLKKGLSEQKAKRLLAEHGENVLKGKKQNSVIKQFILQFKDFCVIILFISCIISFATSLIEGSKNFIEPIVILLIVVINAAIGVFQERKAEKALEALKKMSAPTANVIRSGKLSRIDASLLVPGDIIKLKSGDLVPADARLIESNALKTQESSLTGESVPSEKDAAAFCDKSCALADRKNTVFSSTTVSAGNCTAIITETGMNTQVGKIANLLSNEESPQTPLQIRLSKVGKALAVASLGICALVFILGIIRQSGFLSSFMLSVSLAVAAIPEGLPATVTVILSLGVQLMSKNKAIIRHLPAVETLGTATVICSDKTGTLTQNKMTVTSLKNALGDVSFDSNEGRNILVYASVCNNTTVVENGRKTTFSGDPTETAIIAAAHSCGEKKSEIDEAYPRISETPFSGERKLMSTLNIHNNKHILFVKGAPDAVLPKCISYSVSGKVSPITEKNRSSVLSLNEAMARDALRVIAVAYREANGSLDTNEENLVFLGLIGMTDPPRPEAAKAVAVCKKAGITPVMITGDHIVTACAVAEKLGIIEKGCKAMNGKELDLLDDASLQSAIGDCRVFARVTPEHKVRIVKAFRARGEIVAMTGDGVNDAPALKAADIGCAMGKSGTDVAKNAADMILTDDNFATIVKAVEQGRGIYDNIKKAVHFLLSTNIGEILSVFASSLLGFSAPLVPIQLLWVNLVTDSLPAMALGTENPEKDIMKRAPLSPSKGFFSDGLWLDITLEGLLVGILTILSFSLGTLVFPSENSLALGRTMAFCTLSFCEIAQAINMRSYFPLYKAGIFSNKIMNIAVVVCSAMQCAVVVIPGLASLFGVVPLSGIHWITVFLLSAIPLLAGEAGKIIFSKKQR